MQYLKNDSLQTRREARMHCEFQYCCNILVATLSITVIFVEGEHIKGVKNVFYVHSQGAHAHILKRNNEVVIRTCICTHTVNYLVMLFHFCSTKKKFYLMSLTTKWKYSSQRGVFIVQYSFFVRFSCFFVEHYSIVRPKRPPLCEELYNNNLFVIWLTDT